MNIQVEEVPKSKAYMKKGTSTIKHEKYAV